MRGREGSIEVWKRKGERASRTAPGLVSARWSALALRYERAEELNLVILKPSRSMIVSVLPTYLPAASEHAGRRNCIVACREGQTDTLHRAETQVAHTTGSIEAERLRNTLSLSL
eukprot:5678194-Pleurochrysis_carterae.AAC.2